MTKVGPGWSVITSAVKLWSDPSIRRYIKMGRSKTSQLLVKVEGSSGK